MLTSAPFEGLDGSRVKAISGDVGDDGLTGVGDIDVVIHCAASVSFEQALDEALELNGKGPTRLLNALREAGSDPYFIHVSTAYAAGQRTGLVLERPSGTAPSEPWLDLEAELDAARAWRRDIEAESRLPVHQHRFVKEAERAVGPAGGPAIGSRAEQLRLRVGARAAHRARPRAGAGARLVGHLHALQGDRRAAPDRRRARATSRSSARRSSSPPCTTPYPGWMESLKVADPILLGYGAGLIPGRFAANQSIRMDLIPVDFVANACIVAAAHPPEDGTIRTMNVSTGMRNPFTIHDMAVITTRYFRERPLPDEDGLPVAVPEWRLSSRAEVITALDRAAGLLEKGRNVVDRFPIPRSDKVELRLHKDQRKVDRLRRLNEIYWPYGALDCVFDDRNTRALLDTLHPDDRERFSFDVDEIDWDHYLGDVHLPALRAIAVPPAAGPKKTQLARPQARAGGPARPGDLRRRGRRARLDRRALLRLAAHARHARARQARVDAPAWRPSVPGWIMEDRRSRTAFNRNFYRLYKDLPARELRRAGARGAAGLHPAADPARGHPPDPPAQAPRRQA